MARPRFELEPRETVRSKASSHPHPTCPQLGIQIDLSQWLTFFSPALFYHA